MDELLGLILNFIFGIFHIDHEVKKVSSGRESSFIDKILSSKYTLFFLVIVLITMWIFY